MDDPCQLGFNRDGTDIKVLLSQRIALERGVASRYLSSVRAGQVERDGRDPYGRGLRKVRAPKGELPGNAWAPEGDG